jgi:2-polyprenyl-3-methyl-5-hydroxy-6-metoxy-1,4-benzoquinol methylase
MITDTTIEPTIDQAAVGEFVGQVAADVAAAMSAPLVWLGDKLGLYHAMADSEPVTPAVLARRAGTNGRMTREWLCNQAASGYVTYHPHEGTFTLPPEHAVVLAVDSPAFLQGGFDLVTAVHRSIDKAVDAMRTGQGLGWHDHHHELFDGIARWFRPSYQTLLLDPWLASLDGVANRLASGGTIADIGCGYGATSILLAQAFPKVTVNGFDYHGPSVARARAAAADAGVADRCTFEVQRATEATGTDYDLVCIFDALHDMDDPDGAARRAREMLAPNGILMVVEPIAGDRLEDNLHVIGRLSYAASTLACTPCSLSGGGPGLGAQAGPARMQRLFIDAGFQDVRVAVTTDFNYVLEARPHITDGRSR